ncbi:Aste57867_12808 [Aphanomyces stellatus]|uniref:Aste57867_12808 protein n=1 Tax=Aphanomyces stellatus TaxID=120398 RepID=A0A485KXB8_9STRA|nr:hypothetical protein As57867_012760 [Aphanomyces stellatus]VFT89655.1 Aste57867_12808 [Aphanomyces stellatus]
MSSSDALPEGWEKRESKSQPGRYYYVSPQGQTQWFPPRRAPTVKTFAWRVEIEIEFGPGRLGVNMKEVPQTTNIPFPMFQAEVEELAKLAGGKPGPAEIYNWSVRPERRLYPNMRLTHINDELLAGSKYTDVVDKLRRAPRPVKLKFADVSKGEVGDGTDAAIAATTDDPTSALSSIAAPAATPAVESEFQKQKKRMVELQKLLVTSELSNEMWRLETQKVTSLGRALAVKWDILGASFNALTQATRDVKRDIELATADKTKYSDMLAQLALQDSGAVVSPEIQRMNDLSAKNAELTQDIGHMSAGNKKLRRERDANQRHLDELESQLVHGVNIVVPESLTGVDPTLSLTATLDVVRQKVAAIQFELQREEMKSKQAEADLALASKMYNAQTEVILESSRGMPDMQRRPEPSTAAPRHVPHVIERKPSTVPSPPPRPVASHVSTTGSSRGGMFQRATHADVYVIAQAVFFSLSISLASTPSPNQSIVRQGHLEKFPTHFNQDGGGMLQSMRLMRGARERWCQLHASGTLVYYKKRGDPVPRGEIALTDPTLEVVCEALHNQSSKKPPKELSFTVSTTQAQNRFQATSMDDLREWVTAILTLHSNWMNTRVSLSDKANNNDSAAPPKSTKSDDSSLRRAVEF